VGFFIAGFCGDNNFFGNAEKHFNNWRVLSFAFGFGNFANANF
jgi:hypothetical protein